MKKFFTVFLGSMAAIWASVLIGGVLLIVTLVAVGLSGFGGSNSLEVRKHSILTINLEGEVEERYTPMDLLTTLSENMPKPIALDELLAAITYASTDDDIDGILLNCGDLSAGLAQLEAIREALSDFQAKGKWVYAYGDNYTQGNYYVSSVADKIFINPIGMVDIHGLMATNLYFKDLLDKLGVDVQVVKVGTYKSAVEPFIMNQSSEANRLQQEHYLGSFWSVIRNSIASRRGVTPEKVNEWADGFVFAQSPEKYLEEKIVDGKLYRHELDEMLVKLCGMEKDDSPRYVSYTNYVTAKESGIKIGTGKQIAVLYAVGDITENGIDGIASARLVPEILNLAEDEKIDGLILRINSGGGSAYASEQIWEALQQYKKLTGKPFYVSMSDVAASGGYYIACGADKIYADSLTITGSIGIFGLIPDVHKLLNDKIGVHTSVVATNKGHFPSLLNAMTPEQTQAMQTYVDRGYELFVSRVAKGRDMKVDSVKAIAEGRVWDGVTAKEIGLVDKLGSLKTAIDDMAKKLGAGERYFTTSYPAINIPWWEEFLSLDINAQQYFIKNNLGDFAPLYDVVRNVSELDPLQSRMDVVIIK